MKRTLVHRPLYLVHRTSSLVHRPSSLVLLFLIISSSFAQTPFERVNPFIGTDGQGHTYPGATVPHGMVQLSPDTRQGVEDSQAGYHYADHQLLGFSHTHLLGTDHADLADFLIRPCQDIPTFQHKNEVAQPGYYSVTLDNGIFCELTATEYCGMHHYKYPEGTENIRLLLDLGHVLDNGGYATKCEADVTAPNEICGMRSTHSWFPGRSVYFVLRFEHPFSTTQVYGDYNVSASGDQTVEKTMEINVYGANEVTFKVGLSAHSVEDARRNLEHDIQGFPFADVRLKARQQWERELSRIEVEGGTEDQLAMFYTSLYRVLSVPNVTTDASEPRKQYITYADVDTLGAWNPLATMLGFYPGETCKEPQVYAAGSLWNIAQQNALKGKMDVAGYYIYRIQTELFHNAPLGYEGIEDNGRKSAWYVLTSLGLYPVRPESGELLECKCFFDKVMIDGKPLEEYKSRLVATDTKSKSKSKNKDKAQKEKAKKDKKKKK